MAPLEGGRLAGPRRALRRGGSVAMLAGLLLALLLVAREGFPSVGRAVVDVGWGLVLVVAVHVLQVALSGMAWRAPLAHERAAPALPAFVRARWVREAVGGLLPAGQIGGELAGVRQLTLQGTPGGLAGASVVVDLTMEVLSQFLFTLMGLALLLLVGHSGEVARWGAAGLVLMLLAIVGFFFAQRRGLLRLVERACDWVGDRSRLFGAGAVLGLHEATAQLYRQPGALFRSCNLHLLSWLVGTAEVWLILHLLGVSVTWGEALVLESLGQAVRSAAFLVPGGLGAQEGGFLLLAALFGWPPAAGLALSLVKRVRELVLGLPALLVWQLAEGRRLWRLRPTRIVERRVE